jgi:hypothetical protein
MKHRDRFAGENQQVSAIGKHANTKNRYRVRLLIVYDKFNRGTYRFYELLCSLTAHPKCMDSRIRTWIYGHGGRTKFSTKFSTICAHLQHQVKKQLL